MKKRENTCTFLLVGKDKLREKLAFLVLLTCFWVIVFAVANPLSRENLEKYGYSHESVSNGTVRGALEPIAEGVEISQSFVAHKNNLGMVGVYGTTYWRSNPSLIYVKLLDEAGQIISERVIYPEEWKNNEYEFITFSKIPDSKGKRYTIAFSGLDGQEDNSPSLLYTDAQSTSDGEEAEHLSVNGVERPDQKLVIKVGYRAALLYPICWAVLIALSYAYALVMKRADERTFVWFSVLLGSLFVVLNWFPHALDEATHFVRAYAISQGDWEVVSQGGKMGSMLPANWGELIDNQVINLKTFVGGERQNFSGEQAFYWNPYNASAILINNGIAAVGIWIARLLGLSAMGTVYFARLINYAYYTAACYLAMRNVKHFKSLFFVVATLPAAQWLAGSVSSDPVLTANALLFVSICLKYRQRGPMEKVSVIDEVLLLYCGIGIMSTKFLGYAPILLTIFIIPKECFHEGQRKRFFAGVCIIVLLLVLWQVYLLRKFPYKEDRNGYTDVAMQISFMLSYPIFTLRNFTNYITTTWLAHLQSMHYASAINGVSDLLSVLAVLCAAIAPDKPELSDRERKRGVGLCVLIVSVTYLVIIVGLYVGFTPVGSYSVQGVQTRYWLPILIFVMLGFAMMRVRNESRTYEKHLVFVSELAVLLCLSGTLIDLFSKV